MTELLIDTSMNIDATNPDIASQMRMRLQRVIDNIFHKEDDDGDDDILSAFSYNLTNVVGQIDARNIWITNDKPLDATAGQFDGSKLLHPSNAGRWKWTDLTGLGGESGSEPRQYEKGDAVLYIGDRWVNSTLTSAWPSATGSAAVSFDRMIVHELAHAMTDPTNIAFRDNTIGINYSEEIAAFVENVFYRPYAAHYGLADANVRSMGHTQASVLGGSTGDRYMYDGGDLITTDIQVSTASGDVTFFAFDFSSGISIEKTYAHSGKTISVNATTTYSRYITIEVSNYDGVVSDDGSSYRLLPFIREKVAPDAAFNDPQWAFDRIHSNLALLDTTFTSADQKQEDFLTMLGLGELSGAFQPDQQRFLALGADRHLDTITSNYGGVVTTTLIDVAGPTRLGTTGSPGIIVIDDRNDTFDFGNQTQSYPQYNGAVILGAGGIAAKVGDGPLDTSSSRDNIAGSQGDDVIIAGNRNGLIGNNQINGNEGHDILVAGTSMDIIRGGDGNDLLLAAINTYKPSDGSKPGMTLNGGVGFDTVSYLGANPIILNSIGDDVSAIVDGRTDTLLSIELVVGTDGNDIMTAAPGMTVIGGKGSDSIHLKSGAIAIGGADGDTFDMDVNPFEDSSYLIIGFDQDDILTLNGTRHFGSQTVITGSGMNQVVSYRSGTGANPFATSTDTPWEGSFWSESFYFGYDALNAYGGNAADIDVDDFAMIQIRHSMDGQLTSTTDIFITGFKPGEGGLNFNSAIYGSGGYQIQDPVEAGSVMPYSPTSVGLFFTQDVFF